ncbi:MAG: hypothetical protein KDJ37_02070 [Hyphomicrobiaceae bacterium]|nr:hypothetical protein [Hyphomicrobiaceae bacterium]
MTIDTEAAARAVLVHGVIDRSRPDEQDTLDQVEAVGAALRRSGFDTAELALGLDLSPLSALANDPPALVFNLVEALAGDGRLISLPAAVMEHCGLSVTGSSAMALAVTTDKPLTKHLLAAAGLDVPQTFDARIVGAEDESALYIVKSVSEDASIGIDAASVVPSGDAAREIAARRKRFGGEWFAEAFIDGREFNISLISDGKGGIEVLPAAEIRFEGFAAGRPRIVDYAAKWDPASDVYHATPRRFVPREAEPALVVELERCALAAFRVLGLDGYARVDFRVDGSGRCYILEANANPCLAPDSGFVAACAEAGMDYDMMVGRIVAARRCGARLTAPMGAGT